MSGPLGRRGFLKTAAVAGAAVALRHRRGLSAPSPDEAEAIDSPPIIDTHEHLWDLTRFNLPWLAKAPPVLNRSYLPADFRAATEGLNVVKSVYMEVDVHPAQQVQEAEFAIAQCKEPGTLLAGAVIGGYPQDPGFADYVKRFAGEKSVKGVRTVLHGDRPAGLCLKPEFVESMKRLGDSGLSFDLCMRPGELLDGAKLAGQVPQTTFVLDHCGNIGLESKESAVRRVWCEGIKEAAARPNVVCKISGLIDKTAGKPWTAESLAPNVNFCLDAFGEDRVVFGGDWPVCLAGGGTYRAWVEALLTITRDRPAAFRRKLFSDNATRVYRLT
jgi:L-fuconolactonase